MCKVGERTDMVHLHIALASADLARIRQKPRDELLLRIVHSDRRTVGEFCRPLPLEWNATLLEGDLAESVTALKDRHDRTLVAVGAGELANDLITLGLVDEFWFWVSPSIWPAGPRIFDGVGPVRLELIGSTTFGSGVVRLAYRPAPDRTSIN